MSTHNIGFYEEISKIIFQLSSKSSLNYHQIQTSSVILSKPTFPISIHLFQHTYCIFLHKTLLWVLITIILKRQLKRISTIYSAHLNTLEEVILMNTHNIGFYENLTKKLSLNYHQIHTLFLLLVTT